MFHKCFTCLLLLALSGPVWADDKDAAQAPAADGNADFAGDANDADALRKYAGEVFGEIAKALQAGEHDVAEAKLNALEEFANGLELTDDAAKTTQDRIASAVRFFRDRIELARVSLDDLKKELEEKPTAQGVQQYAMKLGQHLSSLASSEPKKAEEKLAAAKAFLNELAENSESDDDVKRAVRLVGRMFSQLEQKIESERKLLELIGKDAAPLRGSITDWVNGEPLTDDDLKGKVVLLDFWAVWCGPCIATFPNLREWNEKYAEQGLVIVGLTRYYNMAWDDTAERATRSSEEVSPEEERAMLAKFAEAYDLEHRFAIQEDRTLSDFYGVSGIPHVVLVDREGKVRLVKVGAGQQNAKEIGEMIKELIAG